MAYEAVGDATQLVPRSGLALLIAHCADCTKLLKCFEVLLRASNYRSAFHSSDWDSKCALQWPFFLLFIIFAL
jgi:hypothetical protein